MTRAGREEGGPAGWGRAGVSTTPPGRDHTHTPKSTLGQQCRTREDCATTSLRRLLHRLHLPRHRHLQYSPPPKSPRQKKYPEGPAGVPLGILPCLRTTYKHTNIHIHARTHETLSFAVRQQVVPKLCINLFTATSGVWVQCLLESLDVLPGDRPVNEIRSTKKRKIEGKLTSSENNSYCADDRKKA